jgi:endonuclease YncB( thermonuclease family)
MVLEGLEHEALEAKKGLWADPQAALPWEWRKRK